VARFNRTNPPPIARSGYGAFRPYVRDDLSGVALTAIAERYAGGEEGFQLIIFILKTPRCFPQE